METLFEKINRMATSFGADIFVHVRRKDKQKLYTSSEDLSWPAGIKDIIVSPQLTSPLHLANLAKANSYPLPVVITPASFKANTETCRISFGLFTRACSFRARTLAKTCEHFIGPS